jgi:phage gp29-like protein
MDNKPLSLTDEIATRQRVQPFLSFYNYLPDPDPILKKLGKDSKVFADIKSDSHVFSTIQQRKGIVQSLLWEIDKGNATAREVKFIEDIFSNLDVDEIINRMLNTVFNGFSMHEINWIQDGGYFIPSEIIEKPNDWFIFDSDNKPLLRTMAKPFGEQLPDRKFILLQYNASYDNPYGERALAKCFWPVMFKRGGLKFWATMTEKYGMPFIIGKQPRGTKEEETNDLLNHLENMVQDAVAVIPDDSSVEFLEGSKTTSSALYKELLEFCNSEISKAILTQTLTTELQGDGSRAATETHKSLLESLADKKIVERGINQIIRWTCDANFDNGKYPLFRLYQEEDVNKDLADRDAILVGQCGVKFTKEYYAKNYNLDEKDFEVDSSALISDQSADLPADSQEAIKSIALNGTQIASAAGIIKNVSSGEMPRDSGVQQLIVLLGLSKEQAEAVMGSAGTGDVIKADKVVNAPKTAKPLKPETPAAEFAESEVKDYQDILDKMVNNIPPEYFQKQMEKILKPALDYLKKDISFSEMEEGIMKLYPDMNTEELQDRIAKMILVAEILGREDARKG